MAPITEDETKSNRLRQEIKYEVRFAFQSLCLWLRLRHGYHNGPCPMGAVGPAKLHTFEFL